MSLFLAWEASTLPLSYTRQNRIYFSPKYDSCKGGVLASSETKQDAPTGLMRLVEGYRLCAVSEGKSQNTIDIVTNIVNYFHSTRNQGLLTLPKHCVRGGIGEVVALANARTLTLIMPGTKLADVKRSLETIISDLNLRMEYEDVMDQPEV